MDIQEAAGNLQNRYSEERMPNSYIKGKNVFLVARQKGRGVHSLHSDHYGMLMAAQCFFFTLEKSGNEVYKTKPEWIAVGRVRRGKDWNSKNPESINQTVWADCGFQVRKEQKEERKQHNKMQNSDSEDSADDKEIAYD